MFTYIIDALCLQSGDVSVFETNIRYVGGLLSLFALTGDPMFREKAVHVVDKLVPAFKSPTGIPFALINMRTGVSLWPFWPLFAFSTSFRWKYKSSRELCYDAEKMLLNIIIKNIATTSTSYASLGKHIFTLPYLWFLIKVKMLF